jgi:DNA primase
MGITTAEKIKERLSVSDVLGTYIKLEKAGVNFRARCPFHGEKTPSFFVSPSRGTYYCFGCNAKGDIFTFVEKFEGVDFMGALKILADRAGVPVEVGLEDRKVKDTKDRLFSLMEDATTFFEENIKKDAEALSYLSKRGLTEDTIRNFRIGYALPEWRSLNEYLKSKGYSEKEIADSGMGKETSGKWFDRFRGRIMFPICDISGRVVAFSGRFFKPILGQNSDIEPAKYINSPETPLYHKSNILYGMDKAKDGIRRLGFVTLVEGQMDLVMSHQAGYTNSVALSGTALTEEQISTLSRFTDKLLLSLDADTAGVNATHKSSYLALKKGFDVKVARIIGGKDPADIILEDKEKWKEIIKNSHHVIDFYISLIRERGQDERKFRLEVSKTVLPLVNVIPSKIDRAHFVEKIAKEISLPVKDVEGELNRIGENKTTYNENRDTEEMKDLPIPVFSRKDEIIKRTIGLISSIDNIEEKKLWTEKIIEILGVDESNKLLTNEEFVNESAFIAEADSRDGPIDEELEELLVNLSLELQKEKQKDLSKRIKDEERQGSVKIELINEYQSASKKVSELIEKIKSGFSKK